MNSFCGLDFGTSNSALATTATKATTKTTTTVTTSAKGATTNNGIALVPLSDGVHTKTIIPSALFFNSEEKQTVFGARAIDEYVDGYVGRLMRSLKSVLGSSLMGGTTQVGQGAVNYADIIGLFVSFMKQQAQTSIGRELTQVVVGRPVYFVDGNPEADARAQRELRDIVVNAGFKDVSFEFEPIAAALDYETQLVKESIVLTIDIGGGTSDFSIMALSPERANLPDRSADILAHSGVHIGGTDFDRLLSLAKVLQVFGLGSKLSSGLNMPVMRYHELSTWHEINNLYTREALEAINSLRQRAEQPALVKRLHRLLELRRGHYLAQLVEDAKVTLSNSAATVLDLGFVEEGLALNVTEQDLQDATRDSVNRILLEAQATLKLAGLKPNALDRIVLTGGSTAMPGFEDAVAAQFPGVKLVKGNRFASIAQGLGLVAQRRYGDSC